MSWVGEEILALRTLFQGDSEYRAPGRKQVHGLENVLAKVIPEESVLPVLQLISGLPLKSLDMMTGYTVSILIDVFLKKEEEALAHPWEINEYYAQFLHECQVVVESRADADPWRIDPHGL